MYTSCKLLFVFRQAVAYFIYVLDKIVNRDYVIVYLHTLSSEENQPHLSFLKDIYHLVDNKLVCSLYVNLGSCHCSEFD